MKSPSFKKWIPISRLLDEGIAAIPELRPKSGMGGRREKTAGPPGVYCFRIARDKFLKLRGRLASEVLTIGHTSDLTYRLGVFIGAAQGFALWHSAGKKFYHASMVLGLNIRDIEYSYIRVGDNPKTRGNLTRRLQLEKNATDRWREKLGPTKGQLVRSDRARLADALKKVGIKIRWDAVLPILMTNAPGRKSARGE